MNLQLDLPPDILDRLDRIERKLDALRPQEWLTVAEAAERLNMTPQTLRQHAREGKIPFKRVGKRMLFRSEDL